MTTATHTMQHPGSRRALVVGLLTLVFTVAFEAMAVSTAMPKAAQQLGHVELYAWVFTLFVLGMVMSTAVAGRVTDRVGPVKPLVAGMVIIIIGLLIAGTAVSMPILVAGRLVQGIGGGAINLTLMVVVAQAFDGPERSRLMTAFSVCWILPAFIGPLIAAWITKHFSWHWVFLSVIVFVIAAGVLCARPLTTLDRHRVAAEGEVNPVPVWAALAAAASVALVQWSGDHLAGEQAHPRLAVGGMVAGVVTLTATLPPLMPRGFLRAGPGLPAVVLVRFTQAGAFLVGESFIPLLLTETRGATVLESGAALAIGSAGWTLGSWLQARRTWMWRRDHIIVLGAACTAAGVALVWLFAGRPGTSLVVFAAGWIVGGFGMGLSVSSTSLATMTLSEPIELGRNTSSLQVAEGVGNSVVTGLAGVAFHALHAQGRVTASFGALFAIATASALLAFGMSLRIGPVRNETSGAG